MAYMINWMLAVKTIIHSTPLSISPSIGTLSRQQQMSLVTAFSIDYGKNTVVPLMLRLRRQNHNRSSSAWQLQQQHCRIVRSSMSSSSSSSDVSESELKSFATPTSTSDWYVDMDATTIEQQQQQQQQRRISKNFIAFPFEYHEIVSVRIEALTNRGWGLGRIDVSDRSEIPPPPVLQNNNNNNSRQRHRRRGTSSSSSEDESADLDFTVESTINGWVIMTPNVIPGELVRVRIFRNHKNYSEGDAIEILEPNTNERIQPPCPLSNECGGCQYQHISIQAQRKYKQHSVQASLKQFGIVDVIVSPTLGTDEIYEYRSKLTPHYQAPVKSEDGSRSKQIETIGFLRQTSRSIIDVPSCIIATKPVNEMYQREREELLNNPSTRTRGASLLFRQANLCDTVNDVMTDNNAYMTTVINGIKFTYQAGNFFQNNYYVVPIMVNEVVKYASLPSSSCGKAMTHLIDCYCGSGLFALSAASKFQTVVGIEVNRMAVEEATQNAYNNAIKNCQFRSASAEYIFRDIRNYPKDTSVVILDPPRKGCSIDFLQQLIKFYPQRIVYMSCDPQTQARDAQYILQSNKYKITSVQPFDLFPQTRHIECLVIFERT